MNTEHNDTNTPRPLGFWLREVDARLAEEFAAAFAADGITRRDWRVLSTLAGEQTAPGAVDRLRGKKLRRLVERGWVTETDGEWQLTDDGRAAAERLSAQVAGIRARVAGSVSDEDFATTLASLEAIARELGWDETQRPRRRRGPFARIGAPGERFRQGRPGFGPHHHDELDGPCGHRHGDRFGHRGHGHGGFGQGGHRHGGHTTHIHHTHIHHHA